MRDVRQNASLLVGAVLVIGLGGPPTVVAGERIRIERPRIERSARIDRSGTPLSIRRQGDDGGQRQFRHPRSDSAKLLVPQVRPSPRECFNCGGNPTQDPGTGPAPCIDSGSCRDHDQTSALDPRGIRIAERLGRTAVRNGQAADMRIPVDATRAEKKQFMKTVRQAANASVREAIRGGDLPRPYRPFAWQAAKEALGRLSQKIVHQWKAERKEAGLGPPSQRVARPVTSGIAR